MPFEAYLLFKEGYTNLDQVKDISNQMLPLGFTTRQNELKKIKWLIKEERSKNSSKSISDNKSSDSTLKTKSNGQAASSGPNIRSSVLQDEVEFVGNLAVATSYDSLIQWIRNDTYKDILYRVSLTMEEARKLFHVLATNKSLLFLCLRNQSLGDYICRLASTLLQSNGLGGLLLPQSSITHDGADLISSALVNNTTQLKVLSFEDCAIGNEGVLSLARVMKTNTQLRKLDLTNTDCGDEAAREVAKAMLNARTLDELRLGNNRISDTGAQELLLGLMENLSTVKLDLEGNNYISVEVIVKIGKRCKAIKELQMSKCSQTELGSFLMLNEMEDVAYFLYKEGYKTLDEVAEASVETILAVYGVTYDSAIMAKDKVGKPSYLKSDVGAFLLENGYEKYCKTFSENDEKDIRAFDDYDLRNIGVTDEHDRVKLIQLLKEASSTKSTKDDNDLNSQVNESSKTTDTEPKNIQSDTGTIAPLADVGTIKDANISTSYSAFVCHHIKDSGYATSILKLTFKANHPEVKDFYLPHRAHSLDDFLPQVRKSPVFLVLLSKGFFSSKWCIAELIEAFNSDIPFVAVRVIDREEATFEPDEFATLCDTCPVLSDVDGQEFLRLKGLLQNGVYALRELSKTLLIDFDPSHLRTSEVLLNAQVAQIKQRLDKQAKPPGCIYR